MYSEHFIICNYSFKYYIFNKTDFISISVNPILPKVCMKKIHSNCQENSFRKDKKKSKIESSQTKSKMNISSDKLFENKESSEICHSADLSSIVENKIMDDNFELGKEEDGGEEREVVEIDEEITEEREEEIEEEIEEEMVEDVNSKISYNDIIEVNLKSIQLSQKLISLSTCLHFNSTSFLSISNLIITVCIHCQY